MPSPLVLQPDATAGKDAWITTLGATNNYGGRVNFGVGDIGTSAMYRDRALIAFAGISTIPAGSTVVSAQLELYEDLALCGREGATTDDSYLHRVLRDWTEGTSDGVAGDCCWNNAASGTAWGTAGCSNTTSDIDSSPSSTLALPRNTTAVGWRTWTGLEGDVGGFVAGTYSNYGWRLSCPGKEALDIYRDYRRFLSSDDTTASTRPKLTVTYTDGGTTTVPVWLLQHRSIGIGLGGPHA